MVVAIEPNALAAAFPFERDLAVTLPSSLPAAGAIHFLPQRHHQGRRFALFILALGPIAFGCLTLWLGQDANWDLRNYHWYNAFAFLNSRYTLDLLPSQTPYFYNPLLDVPFFVLATHVPARVAGFTLGLVQGLNFDLLFMLAFASLLISNPRRKTLISAGLAGIGLLGGGGIALLGTTFYDNVTSLGLLFSALLVLRYYRTLHFFPGVPALCLAALLGLPAGLMMGLKLPSVIFCVGLCGALFLSTGTFQRRFLLTFGFGIGVCLGVIVSLGNWAWFLDAHFGSPLFPYFNELFQSPLAPLKSARDIQYVVHNLSDAVFFPFIFTEHPLRVGEVPWRDWRIPILYTLLPVVLIVRLVFGRAKRSDDAVALPFASRYLLWTAVLSYAVWLEMFCIYRYLVPLEMLAPLLIVCAMGLLPVRPQPRALLTGVLLIVVCCSVMPGNWSRRASWSDSFVSADIPSLGDASNLMILMAGFEPYSHLVTQFPLTIPFIRIQSNFASPDEDKGINALLHERVDGHRGPMMILIPPWQHALSATALSYYKLSANWEACQNVVDRLYDDHVLDLCPVTRLKE